MRYAEQESKNKENGAKKAKRSDKALEAKAKAKKKRIEAKLRKYITKKYGKIE
jgi:hypothetical protein